jgi:putative flippase GtrA
VIGFGVIIKFFDSTTINRLWSRQSFRFFFIGGTNAVLGIGILRLLVKLFDGRFSDSVIYTITYLLVVGLSYYCQRIFVWKSKNAVAREIFRYLSVSVSNYLVNLLILVEIVEKNHLPFVESQIFIGLSLALLNFTLSKFWVFIRK